MTIESVFEKLKKSGFNLTFIKSYPTPYCFVSHRDFFTSFDVSIREEELCKKIEIEVEILREFDRVGICNFRYLSSSELEKEKNFFPENQNLHTWASWYLKKFLKNDSFYKNDLNDIQIRHFFGFKGGQGRSTLAAMCAKHCALQGQKVLFIEADIEAPSIHGMFGTDVSFEPASTLVGLASSISPRPAVIYSSHTGGEIQLIAVRQNSPLSELEALAFSTRCSIDPTLLFELGTTLNLFARKEKFDVVLVDHRAGVTPFLPPLKESLPGPVCLVCRLDKQWEDGSVAIQGLLESYSKQPGWVACIDSFDETLDQFVFRTKDQVEKLVRLWPSQGESSQLDEEFLSEIRVMFPHCKAFLYENLPSPDTMERNWKNAFLDFVELIELNDSSSKKDKLTTNISGSLATDPFLESQNFLSVKNNKHQNWYIFGRKGTGKTRFFNQLSVNNECEPLLVDRYFDDGKVTPRGLIVDGPVFKDIKDTFFKTQNSKKASFQIDKATCFILFLIASGLESERGLSRDLLEQKLRTGVLQWCNSTVAHFMDWIIQLVNQSANRFRVFLIDNIELGFDLEEFKFVIPGLFKALSHIETETQISSKFHFRLFLRSDLVNVGVTQNLEQQLSKKRIDLFWTEKEALNLFLTQLCAQEHVKKKFSNFVDSVLDPELNKKLIRGSVDVEHCLSLLKEVFPEKITDDKARPVLLKNFFINYFSDGGFDEKNSQKVFYPRLFVTFSEELDKYLVMEDSIENGRVDIKLPYKIHEKISEEFLVQVTQEIKTIVKFSGNKITVTEFLNCFKGQSTPFDPEILAELISKELWKNDHLKHRNEVKKALESLKMIGVLEGHPKNREDWRASRLFKYALKMKWRKN